MEHNTLQGEGIEQEGRGAGGKELTAHPLAHPAAPGYPMSVCNQRAHADQFRTGRLLGIGSEGEAHPTAQPLTLFSFPLDTEM